MDKWKTILSRTRKAKALYLYYTRNPNKIIRETFRRDKDIMGTSAWAICTIMHLKKTSTPFDDATCDLILKAL